MHCGANRIRISGLDRDQAGAPVVSVVIPTVRGRTVPTAGEHSYLSQAVASVQAQTLPDWELIIVADGCAEDLTDLHRGDPRIRTVSQPRRGVSVARNVGASMARSELIMFLDDDDRLLPGCLQLHVDAMADPTIGICHPGWRFIEHDGRPIPHAVSPDARAGDELQYADMLAGAGIPPVVGALIRRGLFQAVGGFDSTMRVCEDWDLIYRLARESRLRRLPAVVVEYRRHQHATHPITPSFGDELRGILMRHLCWAEAAGNDEDVRAARVGLTQARYAHARSAIVRARAATSAHDRATALRLTARAFLLSPTRALGALLRGPSRDGTHRFAAGNVRGKRC